MKWSLKESLVIGCGSGLLGVLPGLVDGQVPLAGPNFYNELARTSVSAPLELQARNGLVLEQTLWNHHFKDGELLRSGMKLLDRLGRRKNEPVVEIYLQTARDVGFVSGQADKYQASRSGLDGKRLQAIQEYVSASQPEVTFVVRVHDPNKIGMPAVEAAKAFGEMQAGARGVIPVELLQQTLSSSIQSSSKSGAQAPPAPSLPPPSIRPVSSVGPEAAAAAQDAGGSSPP